MMKYESSYYEKQAAKQKAFDYCMYMMLGSYFEKAVCDSKELEKQLYLYYKETKEKLVYEMEEQSLKMIETQILDKIPKRYLEGKAIISLRRKSGFPVTEIIVHFEDKIFVVATRYNRKKTEMDAKWYYKRTFVKRQNINQNACK